MTEDDITRGMTQKNVLTGKPYTAVPFPSRVETVIASLPTGDGGTAELWKLNHYYERLDDWHADNGIAPPPGAAPAAEPLFEMHNLTADPNERHNHAEDAPQVLSSLKSLLEAQRDAKRLLPKHRNPPNAFAARLAQLRDAAPAARSGHRSLPHLPRWVPHSAQARARARTLRVEVRAGETRARDRRAVLATRRAGRVAVRWRRRSDRMVGG